MRIIKPITVDATTLKYSSISETDDGYPEWEENYTFSEVVCATGSSGEQVTYYKSSNGTLAYNVGILEEHFTYPTSLSLSPSGVYLFVCGSEASEYSTRIYRRGVSSAGTIFEYERTINENKNLEYFWSPDGRFVCSINLEAPIAGRGFFLYYFNNGELSGVEISGSSPYGAGYDYDASFSRDNKFLALNILGNIHIYKIVSNSLIEEVSVIKNVGPVKMCFSPSENILVAGIYAYPAEGILVYTYDEDGNFEIETDDLGINTGSELDSIARFCKPAFSQSGQYLAMASFLDLGVGVTSVFFYEWDGSAFGLVTEATTPATGVVRAVKFSGHGNYCYVAHGNSPYFSIYYPDGSDVFQKQTNPATIPTASVNSIVSNRSDTTYMDGDVVRVDNFLYESLKDHNLSNPENTPTVLTWIEISPINRWKMFDEYANTSTTEDGPITVQIEAENIAHVGLLGLSGASEVTVTRYNSSDVSQWTTTETTTDTDRVIIDLDEATGDSGDYVEVVIGSVTDDDISVARCVVGEAAITYERVQYGMEYSPISWGKTDENDYGNVYLKPGNYADEFNVEMYIEDTDFDTVAKFFRDYRETKVLWDINGSTTDTEFLIVYGFYLGRPRITLQHPNDYLVSFKIREFT